MAANWKEVRDRSGLDKDRVAAHEDRMLAEVRAHRLAELRKEHHLSQQEVAERMHVAQTRVSAIERGDITAAEVSTISRYVAALGGTLKVVAELGGKTYVIG